MYALSRTILPAGIAFLASLALSVSAKAVIDFTPSVNRYVSEGAEYATATFKDDKRSVSMAIPRLWTCRGDASRLQFSPPDENFAEGVVQAVPINGVLRFDEATLKALEQQTVNALPPSSQAITVVSRQENTVLIEGNPSYEFVVSYQALGQAFQRSVIFVNCPGQQLVFRFSAPKKAFDTLNRSFRQSIYTWHWSQPASTAVVAQTNQPSAAPARE
jgi:hypothetical protein